MVIISFLLSLGKYFPSLSHFAIDYIPLYNKFRDVKNIIFIQNFAMWLIGFMALGEMLLKKDTLQKEYLKALKLSTIIAGGFTLLFAIIPSLAGSFTGSVDAQLAGSGWTESLLSKLRSDRIAIARMDALRSTLFIVLAAGLVWVYLKGKIKNQYILIIASVVILADLWPTNKRYLNNDDFTSKRKAEVAYTATKADQAILQDKSLDYRVLNMSVNPWSDASTSFYHKSIGGYAGAKMQRYQDMIEYHLSPELQKLGGKLRTVKSQADVDQLFVGLNGLNMLNTKYTIYNPNAAPLQNTSAMGNAWFVNDVVIVADANEEIDKIDEVDISNIAIVDKRFENLLPTNTSSDPTALISLESYTPNKLVYKTRSQQEQIAVFSEIYYPKGWIAFIDGKEASHFRANYILRSMVVPAGEHEVVFEFKPQSYEIGNKVSFASSLILLLAAAGVVFIEIRKKRLQPKDEE